MSDQKRTISCPDCGHGVLRPEQDRCTECGLQWDDWLDRESNVIALHARDWLILFLVFPVIASVLPLLSGRGAITGARTFEASYLLTIPGFVGILYLSWRYARPLAWRFARRARVRGAAACPPQSGACAVAFLLLLVVQVVLYLVVIRTGFILFVEPLRPKPPPLQAPSTETSTGTPDPFFIGASCSRRSDGRDWTVRAS